MTVWVWIGVVFVGGIGAIARFMLDALIGQHAGRDFPLGTLAINLIGSFVLGLLTGLDASVDLLLVAGTATIGSFTTFSTWMLETYRLTEDDDPGPATTNALGSLLLGFAAALLGRTIGVHL